MGYRFSNPIKLRRVLLSRARLAPRVQRSTDILSVGPADVSPAVAKAISSRCARLLIGDQAIRFRQRHAAEFNFWDLGEQWNKVVGLPFVYALWLIRPEVRDFKSVANRLRALRDENLANLDQLIAEVVAPRIRGDPGHRKEFDPQFYGRYYREHLRFSFGEKEKEGLRTFANLCAKHGLLPKRDHVFDLV